MAARPLPTLRVAIHLRPGSRANAIDGWRAGADGARVLTARVIAAPEDGKANAALVALLAEALDMPKSRIDIVGGAHSRMKRVELSGDAALLAARLEKFGEAR